MRSSDNIMLLIRFTILPLTLSSYHLWFEWHGSCVWTTIAASAATAVASVNQNNEDFVFSREGEFSNKPNTDPVDVNIPHGESEDEMTTPSDTVLFLPVEEPTASGLKNKGVSSLLQGAGRRLATGSTSKKIILAASGCAGLLLCCLVRKATGPPPIVFQDSNAENFGGGETYLDAISKAYSTSSTQQGGAKLLAFTQNEKGDKIFSGLNLRDHWYENGFPSKNTAFLRNYALNGCLDLCRARPSCSWIVSTVTDEHWCMMHEKFGEHPNVQKSQEEWENWISEETVDSMECTADYGDCRFSGCCANQDSTCYEKGQGYAQCRPSGNCPAGKNQDWTCKILKSQTEKDFRVAIPEGSTVTATRNHLIIPAVPAFMASSSYMQVEKTALQVEHRLIFGHATPKVYTNIALATLDLMHELQAMILWRKHREGRSSIRRLSTSEKSSLPFLSSLYEEANNYDNFQLLMPRSMAGKHRGVIKTSDVVSKGLSRKVLQRFDDEKLWGSIKDSFCGLSLNQITGPDNGVYLYDVLSDTSMPAEHALRKTSDELDTSARLRKFPGSFVCDSFTDSAQTTVQDFLQAAEGDLVSLTGDNLKERTTQEKFLLMFAANAFQMAMYSLATLREVSTNSQSSNKQVVALRSKTNAYEPDARLAVILDMYKNDQHQSDEVLDSIVHRGNSDHDLWQDQEVAHGVDRLITRPYTKNEQQQLLVLPIDETENRIDFARARRENLLSLAGNALQALDMKNKMASSTSTSSTHPPPIRGASECYVKDCTRESCDGCDDLY